MLVAIHENVSQPLIGRPGVQGCADRWQGVCLSRPARLARNRDIPRLAVNRDSDRLRAGRPVGVQIVGPWLEDPTPLKLAELIEREFGGLVPPKMFDD